MVEKRRRYKFLLVKLKSSIQNDYFYDFSIIGRALPLRSVETAAGVFKNSEKKLGKRRKRRNTVFQHSTLLSSGADLPRGFSSTAKLVNDTSKMKSL